LTARAAPGARYTWAVWAELTELDARAAWNARAAWDARAARTAIMVWYAARAGRIASPHDLLTSGLREAYEHGLALAVPVAPHELGWAMVAREEERS
jgi:hypothetical protein